MRLKDRFQANRAAKRIAKTPHNASIQYLIDMVGEHGDAAGLAEDPRVNDMVNQAENWQPKSHEDRLRVATKEFV